MSDHGIDQQPENLLITKINDLQRQITELRTLQTQGQAALNLQDSGNYTATASVPSNFYLTAIFRFTNTDPTEKKLFGTFHFTMYEDTAATAGKEISYGTDVTIDSHWEWRWWRDKAFSDGKNLVEFIAIHNVSASTLPLYITGNWRYIISSGVGST